MTNQPTQPNKEENKEKAKEKEKESSLVIELLNIIANTSTIGLLAGCGLIAVGCLTKDDTLTGAGFGANVVSAALAYYAADKRKKFEYQFSLDIQKEIAERKEIEAKYKENPDNFYKIRN